MNDSSVNPNVSFEYAEVMRRFDETRRRRAGLRDANKAALFAVLEKASIARVCVMIDGGGDSGQIETIDAEDGEGRPVPLPVETLSCPDLDGDGETPRAHLQTVAEAIDTMAYGCLEETHPGWENNDGADGTFTFDVATRTITLEHNQRYTDTTFSEHVF